MSETKTKEKKGFILRALDTVERTAEPGNDFYHFNSGCHRDFRDLCSVWCICNL